MRAISVLFCGLALLCTAAPARRARADIFSHTDADGVVHYTNVQPRGTGWRRTYKEAKSGGQFTDEQLTAALASLGFDDAQRFLATMRGAEVRGFVERDVQEAQQVGLRGTPTLFINGVQLVGLNSVAALHDNIDELKTVAEAADEPLAHQVHAVESVVKQAREVLSELRAFAEKAKEL